MLPDGSNLGAHVRVQPLALPVESETKITLTE